MGHRSMLGREIDMEKLMRQNELMPAVGNMRVNARGDELGPGGKIVKKREEIVADYYEQNPNAILKPTAPAATTTVIEDEKPAVISTPIKSTKKNTEE